MYTLITRDVAKSAKVTCFYVAIRMAATRRSAPITSGSFMEMHCSVIAILLYIVSIEFLYLQRWNELCAVELSATWSKIDRKNDVVISRCRFGRNQNAHAVIKVITHAIDPHLSKLIGTRVCSDN